MRLPIVLGLLASTVLIGPHAKASPVTFSDGTFNLAGYSISTGLENGGASSTPTQCSNCGNPSGLAARRTELTIPHCDSNAAPRIGGWATALTVPRPATTQKVECTMNDSRHP
jgi:hypothetical protein